MGGKDLTAEYSRIGHSKYALNLAQKYKVGKIQADDTQTHIEQPPSFATIPSTSTSFYCNPSFQLSFSAPSTADFTTSTPPLSPPLSTFSFGEAKSSSPSSPCIGSDVGCKFIAIEGDLVAHMATCPFALLRPTLLAYQRRIERLESVLLSKGTPN